MVFLHKIKKHKNVAEHKQKAAGKIVQGAVGDDHQQCLEILFSLLDSGEIDPYVPGTAIKQDVFDALSEQEQDKIDLELHTIGGHIRMIQNMREQGADLESVHFHNIIEHLWKMVDRIKIENDVFKF